MEGIGMEYADGDAARTMALLWRTTASASRGPKQRLDLDEVVDAAITAADAGGLGALSMRTVAQALGIGAASLYTYVPGRAELLELMVDRVAAAEPLPQPRTDQRAGLVAYAEAELQRLRDHPWLLQVATSRTVLGPGVLARYDAALGLLDGSGLPAATVVEVVAAIDAHVRGAGAPVVEAEQAHARTARSDDAWWSARAPLLDEQLADRFPRLRALDAAGAFTVVDTERPYLVARALARFRSGLALLLDGVATLSGR